MVVVVVGATVVVVVVVVVVDADTVTEFELAVELTPLEVAVT